MGGTPGSGFFRETQKQADALGKRHAAPVILLTLRIAGPAEDAPLLRRAFRAGQEQLEAGLTAARLTVLERTEHLTPAGCAGLYAVDGPAEELRALCLSIAESSPLGQLFDLEVLDAGGRPGREAGTGSAGLRAARRILEECFAAADENKVSALVTQALLDEVCTTPKPGLVDRANNGSHRDMDIFTFNASAAALAPYWGSCFRIGRETAELSPAETFAALKRAGQGAERAMFAATGGVNTHKGAIFTLGTICGAAGRLWRAEEPCRDPEAILAECAAMTSAAMEEALAALSGSGARTAGERAYLEQGLTGARGEAARGFPGVLHCALPALKAALAAGRSRNDAGAAALLHLIARGTDTNMAARGGPERAKKAAEDCARLLERRPLPEVEEISQLDREFIRDNLSPGGCADLLAAAFFLKSWEEA